MAHIVIVLGGPGAGKSSLCRALCERLDKVMYIEVDRIRESMLKGFAMPNPAAGDDGEWAVQWGQARRCAEFMAKLYADDGIDVVIDDANIPSTFRTQFGTLFDDPRTTPVFVYPGQAEQVRRMQLRNGPFDHLLIEGISGPFFVPYQEGIDTTGWVDLRDPSATVEHNVDAVQRAMAANAAARAG